MTEYIEALYIEKPQTRKQKIRSGPPIDTAIQSKEQSAKIHPTCNFLSQRTPMDQLKIISRGVFKILAIYRTPIYLGRK